MADLSTCPPLIPSSITSAHTKISPYIHHTPLLTNRTIDRIASTPISSRDPSLASSSSRDDTHSSRADSLAGTETDTETEEKGSETETESPQLRLWFKCENTQRIGAFKARGAFHAVLRLGEERGMEEVRRRGVVTHSSGNHAQALALAASTFNIPAHIVMPTISTPSKISGTQAYTPHVRFSGSTSQEREAMVSAVQEETGAILVPPYDHPDIILGQGTAGMEMERQFLEKMEEGAEGKGKGTDGGAERVKKEGFDAVITPLGGGGMLSGTAIWYSDKTTLVFGSEPNYQGGNDGELGLKAVPPKRIETVKTLTIADGLRTPVGKIPWSILTGTTEQGKGKKMIEGVYSVNEDQIKSALKLVMERMKVVVEPSSVVPLAVVLYNEEWRRMVLKKQKEQGEGVVWDVGVVFTGGNTTLEALAAMFGNSEGEGQQGEREKRAEGKVGLDGKAVAENVAG